jgi:4,5-DOPA dioxygenase extradiol
MKPLFLAHGSPYLIFEKEGFPAYLNELGKQIKPKAIVIISAHWESETTTVSSTDDVHEMVYDYYGFPPQFYEVRYPARGSSIVASIVEERFRRSGIPVQTSTRGLDHGVFPVLMHMYPEADIPVVPVSVNPFLPIAEQYKIGAALRGLGDEGILVIGSGFVVHNLREFDRDPNGPKRTWAVEFIDWLKDKVVNKDLASLNEY